MDANFIWSDVDSIIGTVAFQAEDLVGLTVRNHAEFDDDDDWDDDDEEGWDEEGQEEDDDEDWDDDDDEDWDDDDDDSDA